MPRIPLALIPLPEEERGDVLLRYMFSGCIHFEITGEP